jgi:ABC-type uncharacterized transport system auxiliary subunit
LVAAFAFASTLAGCQPEAPPSTSAAPSAVVVGSAAPAPVAVTSVAPSASSAPAPAPITHLDLAAIRGSTDARCAPAHPATNNLETKFQMSETATCVEHAMDRELDKVLLPLKITQPARFRALMEQQAAYRRLESSLSFLAEETTWVDFVRGTRSDGTARGIAKMSATHAVWLDRVAYARALAAGDATALAADVKAHQKAGHKARRALADIKADSARNTLVPPAPPGEDTGETVLGGGEWKTLFANAALAEEASRDLARSTCEDFPGLEAALGGAGPCREAVALHHLSIVVLEPMRGE